MASFDSYYTDFRPFIHGFRFVNYFRYEPALERQYPLLIRLVSLPLKPAQRRSIVMGFAPGMCAAALDYFFSEQEIPRCERPDELPEGLLRFIVSRSAGAMDIAGILRTQRWMALPAPLLQRLVMGELPRIFASIDQKRPVPIVIIRCEGQSPLDLNGLFLNHYALVVGYRRSPTRAGDEIILYLYDPNHPMEVPYLRIRPAPDGSRVELSQSTGEPLSGFFLQPYQHQRPPKMAPAGGLPGMTRAALPNTHASNVWADAAIHAGNEDRFSYMTYAQALASQILEAGTPLTIAIHGPWGSGKTSLMHLVDSTLQWRGGAEKKIYSLWIDAWSLGSQDEVWQAFLQALFNEVNRRLPLSRRIHWRKLFQQLLVNSYRVILSITPVIIGALFGVKDADWGTVLKVLLDPTSGSVVAASGAVATYILVLWTIIKPAVEKGQKIVQFDLKETLKFASYAAQISELMKLRSSFDAMVRALVGRDGRIVVFIDDLDRCAPDKIADVLEAVKLFAHTNSCVYVLGIDPEIVRASIMHHYSYSDKCEADDYLDKIIQIPFYLPPLDSAKVIEFVRDYYADLQEKCPTAAEVFSRGLEPNPRKVKRALNIFRTQMELARERFLSWEIDALMDLELLAKMVVLQSCFPDLYSYLVARPEFLQDLERCARAGKLQREALDPRFNRADPDLAELKSLLLGEKGEKGLVSAANLKTLEELFTTGKSRFSDESQREQITDYIYLSSSAREKSDTYAARERALLLGSDDETAQRAAVDQIMAHARGDPAQEQILRESYSERLGHVQYFYMIFKPEEVKRATAVSKIFTYWPGEVPKEQGMG